VRSANLGKSNLCLAFLLQVAEFANAAAGLLGGAKFGIQKGRQDFLGQFNPDNPRAHAKHVHIVVLDALSPRVGVVTQRGSDLSPPGTIASVHVPEALN
jgi:hypothetical protein